ncbi:hydrogenase [Hydrogenobacter thermophilus]|uniref:hydrogenase n=1 Tax=Hydrogenobacter thermophilus TaxID=940 RepID=UPI0026F15A80|nr:hydrogenase [Hydrogenobacter thermophilus]
MEQLASFFALMVLVLSILNVASPFLKFAVNLNMLQSWMLSLYILLVAINSGVFHLYLSFFATLVFKGLIVPILLFRVLRRIGKEREIDMVVSIPSAVVISGMFVLVSSILSTKLTGLEFLFGRFVFVSSLSTLLIGGMLLVIRKILFSQILGLLIMENAIFLAANSAATGMPLIVELGVLFDILISVLISSVLLLRIRRSFEDIQVESLEVLKE